ncbi:MAG TPA: hypothetical protein PKZ44_09075 [Flavobacterium sp.]|nr:hypothetical protein [Flavobacterium sp.]
MKKITIILSLISFFTYSCSSDNDNDTSNNLNNNGFTVDNIFYSTPEFIIGPVNEKPDRGFDIYEFYFKNGNNSFIHLDLNSPDLNKLKEMTYQIINEDGRLPGVSLLSKNGTDYPGKDEDYYYNASTNYKDGYIKVSKEGDKFVFEYEFNYYDSTKNIKGYAKQP